MYGVPDIVELRQEFNRDVPFTYTHLLDREDLFVDIGTPYVEELFDAVHNCGPYVEKVDEESIRRIAFLLGTDPEVDICAHRERLQREGEPKERSNILKPWTEEYLGGFGKRLKNIVSGRNFIDLGDGGSSHAADMAQNFEARRYIGVDIARNQDWSECVDGFECFYLQDDMLRFVSGIHSLDGAIFLLSGIEPASKTIRPVNQYIDALVTEMSRVSQPGDAILLGPLTFSLHEPQKYRFRHEETFKNFALYVSE